MDRNEKYMKRGVSAQKEDVHHAVKSMDPGLFPGAFCRGEKDFKASPGFEEGTLLLHADGAGTKSSLAYMYWKETGDFSVFRGIAQDALIMNIDDLLCVGADNHYLVSSTIGRCKSRVPGKAVSEIIQGTQEVIDLLKSFGADIRFCGGETADVGDLVRTLIVDSTVMSRMDKRRFIDASQIRPGLVIVALASYGQSTYEKFYNAGMGSNGLTSARHDLFDSYYRERYPETYDDTTDKSLIYCGDHKLTDPLEGTGVNIAQAVLSPTRTYYPIVKEVLKDAEHGIKGMIHVSGGAQTKCMKFSKGIHYVKDNLFTMPPLFKLLAQKNGMREMFEVFNSGHRMEFYVEESCADRIIDIARGFNVDAGVVGFTEAAQTEKNHLTIQYENETYTYG